MFSLSFIILAVTILASTNINVHGRRMQISSDDDKLLHPVLVHRDVYNPKITSPTAATTWVVGSVVTVNWDVSDMPKKTTNPKGKVLLGHFDNDRDGEHLDVDHPLAEGFDIQAGHVEVTVPQVEHRNDYIIVLFGDSGNKSPTFMIN